MEDYTAIVTPCNNKKGFRIDYIYYAPWFLWKLPEDQLAKIKQTVFIECIACILLFVTAAVIPSGLNALRLVAFPALLAVSAFVAATGCLYYMVRYVFSISGTALMLCYFAEAALSYLIRRQYARIPFTTELNDILNHVERAVPD